MKRMTPPAGQLLNLGRTDAIKTAETMRRVILENTYTLPVQRLAQQARRISRRYNLPQDLAAGLVAYKVAYYEPDDDAQTIRTPARTLRDKAANCVDYTVLICCLALHWTNDVKFELAAYNDGDFTHVYPVIDGRPVDVVPDQNQTGRERVERTIGKLPTFDHMRGKITPVKTKLIDIWNSTY